MYIRIYMLLLISINIYGLELWFSVLPQNKYKKKVIRKIRLHFSRI